MPPKYALKLSKITLFLSNKKKLDKFFSLYYTKVMKKVKKTKKYNHNSHVRSKYQNRVFKVREKELKEAFSVLKKAKSYSDIINYSNKVIRLAKLQKTLKESIESRK